MRTLDECKFTEEHIAHMAINDECPWCGSAQGFCRACGRFEIVMSEKQVPGFGGERIVYMDLACGHQVVERWGDPMAGVR